MRDKMGRRALCGMTIPLTGKNPGRPAISSGLEAELGDIA
jgi:hypothetical protein